MAVVLFSSLVTTLVALPGVHTAIRSNFPRLPAVSELISLSGVTGSSSGLRLCGVVSAGVRGLSLCVPVSRGGDRENYAPLPTASQALFVPSFVCAGKRALHTPVLVRLVHMGRSENGGSRTRVPLSQEGNTQKRPLRGLLSACEGRSGVVTPGKGC